MTRSPYQPSTAPWPKSDAEMKQQLANLVAAGSLHPATIESPDPTLSHRLENLALKSLGFFLGILPETVAVRLMRRLSRAIGFVARSRNREILQRLERGFPEKSDTERRRILSGVWANMGQGLYELVSYSWLGPKLVERGELTGHEAVLKRMSKGQAIMFLVAHQGNWELIPKLMEPVVGNMTYIYASQSNPTQNLWALYRRTVDGSHGYPRTLKEAGKLLTQDMIAGYPMIIALDQALPGPEIPFFGMPAHTATGPLRMAQQARAAVIPVEIRRRKGIGALQLNFLPALDMGSEDQKRSFEEVMTDYNQVLEKSIRGAPEEWFWLHKRWKKVATRKRHRQAAPVPQEPKA